MLLSDARIVVSAADRTNPVTVDYQRPVVVTSPTPSLNASATTIIATFNDAGEECLSFCIRLYYNRTDG